jgi:hypothetical protein
MHGHCFAWSVSVESIRWRTRSSPSILRVSRLTERCALRRAHFFSLATERPSDRDQRERDSGCAVEARLSAVCVAETRPTRHWFQSAGLSPAVISLRFSPAYRLASFCTRYQKTRVTPPFIWFTGGHSAGYFGAPAAGVDIHLAVPGWPSIGRSNFPAECRSRRPDSPWTY